MKRKGFTLIELLVVIGIIALLVSILMPALSRAKELAKRTVCSANMAGIGKATNIYMNENKGRAMKAWTINGNTAKAGFGTGLYNGNPGEGARPRFAFINDLSSLNSIQTAGNCLFLLVRYADVTPESFVCPSASGAVAMDMKNAIALNANVNDWTDCSDFDSGVNLSYSYNDPWGRQLDDTTGASAALAADKNQAFDTPTLALHSKVTALPVPFGVSAGTTAAPSNPDDWDWSKQNDPANNAIERAGNSMNHSREIQQVVFADGHVKGSVNPCVGLAKDNIYTYNEDRAIAGPMGYLYIGTWGRVGNGENITYSTKYGAKTEDSYLGN